MLISEIIVNESRRNTDKNPKTSINIILNDYLAKSDKFKNTKLRNLFVSFTELPKLGINPLSIHSYQDTPLGIYSYPVEYVIKRVNMFRSMGYLPYAGDYPFANVFSVNKNANVLILQNITPRILNYYIDKIKKELLPKLEIEDSWDGFGSMLHELEQENKSSGYVLWKLTEKLGISMSNDISLGWNAVCRKLGIDGFIDLGEGIIHPAEKTQAVFFKSTSDVIKLIDRVSNKYSPSVVANRQEYGARLRSEREAIKSIIKNMNHDDMNFISDMAKHYNILYLKYSPKDVRLKVLRQYPELLTKLAKSRNSYRVDIDEVLSAINNNQSIYEKFKESNLMKFLNPQDIKRLKNLGYDFTKVSIN